MFGLLLTLRKGEEVKYLSHRDIIRTFELAMRRADIPVAYSEGFNPRARMRFGSAISVGITSDDERIQVELASPRDPREIAKSLNSALPVGIDVVSAETVPAGEKSALSALNASEFRITAFPGCECGLPAIQAAIEKLLSSPEIRVVRERETGSRDVDIRPYLLRAEAVECEDGSADIHVILASGNSGGAGPKDFVQAIRLLVPDYQVRTMHRVRQLSS